MKGTINAHRLLAGTSSHGGYLGSLGVSREDEQALRAARELVRQTLREKLPLQQKMLKQHGFVDEAFRGRDLPLKPKFRMQGSAVYFTLNDPAHKPPQQIDYDDGVFLPTSFLNDGASPALAARGYFKAVEDALAGICADRAWTLSPQNSCVRILGIIPGGHLDFPLYAIPDEQYVELTEAAKRDSRVALMDTLEFADGVYDHIPDDHIMLATRDRDWEKSDPRKIEEWFKRSIQDYGDGLRHVCRYLKGWRDFNWMGTKDNKGPSSLALMACVVRVYDDLAGEPPKNRDDLALLLVAERLPALFAEEIPNPNPEIQSNLCDGWDADLRRAYVQAAQIFANGLHAALQETSHSGVAIKRLRRCFGDRIPDRVDLINIETVEEEVLAYTASVVSEREVKRTISG